MNLIFKKKFYSFKLSTKVENSKNTYLTKSGWIIKLTSNDKKIGFGEVSPLDKEGLKKCAKQLNMIPEYVGLFNLSDQINSFHPCIQSAINSALAEINEKIIFKENYYFDEIDKTAILLNPKNVISDLNEIKKRQSNIGKSVTIKWKVALKNNHEEEAILEEILSQIGNNIKLRIDANGSWGREMANRWTDILKDNKNIDWLEQPLSVDDIDGMKELNKKIPIALDESLLKFPTLIDEWKGWQIRRPSQENNPIKLLRELENKKALISISTSFETGIGRRWLYHLSSLQLQGPTPKVPGLAMNKFPNSFLFLNEAKMIWNQL
ncbi:MULTISPECIES: o-succinylbenzoate synthase [Prochlorococcus]|uniref:O-succinylbenzoate synthase n=1 Tax=Prochlorococcus marinus str. MIT 9116 TaxID=167544 RepID=A0A0A1ZKR1_PROMR|nr:o-succinylbenzoate synthase [Prochlorococcus marinus]KGF89234.1 O-succinylbenzoate synthase [Prochlorococcus marinus str. MIT 9107]KGF89990.1 O-succinylbenzoate synthase [Prochlorococcus marinus str. MIT 9116]KGF95426.1 O-succinylbenzoate synthase [Prochlorococcus marinus str. MIT 9123]